jgi:hypothetical protein
VARAGKRAERPERAAAWETPISARQTKPEPLAQRPPSPAEPDPVLGHVSAAACLSIAHRALLALPCQRSCQRKAAPARSTFRRRRSANAAWLSEIAMPPGRMPPPARWDSDARVPSGGPTKS